MGKIGFGMRMIMRIVECVLVGVFSGNDESYAQGL
jgi:hypothetical protein